MYQTDKIDCSRLPTLDENFTTAIMTGTGSLSEDDISVKFITPTQCQVNRLVASIKLLTFKRGGWWRFRLGDLHNWVASRIGRAMVDDDEGAE